MLGEHTSFDEQIRSAIASRQLIALRYDGDDRVAEPHDYGTQNGRERLLVFQLNGPSRPGRAATGWRLLDVSKIEALSELDVSFEGSRGRSYHRHYTWDAVYARVT